MSRKKTYEANALSTLAEGGVVAGADAQALHAEVRAVLAQARQQVYRKVNQAMVRAYWQVGQLIVQHEQAGQARAAYGARVLEELASRLTAEFGKGFAVQSLRNFRQLYLTLPDEQIRSTPWSELSWSHLKALMRVQSAEARTWYASEALAQTWSVAALSRQIGTLYFERLLSSQDQPAVKAEAAALIAQHAAPNPRDFIRDPYVLDFLGAQPGDQPTIGLILCSERNEAVARYSLLAESRQLFASRYQPWLPTEAELQAELTRDRALLELARGGEGAV